jgi:hypothetical protein
LNIKSFNILSFRFLSVSFSLSLIFSLNLVVISILCLIVLSFLALLVLPHGCFFLRLFILCRVTHSPKTYPMRLSVFRLIVHVVYVWRS